MAYYKHKYNVGSRLYFLKNNCLHVGTVVEVQVVANSKYVSVTYSVAYNNSNVSLREQELHSSVRSLTNSLKKNLVDLDTSSKSTVK